jgi:hypothetical protein
VGRNELHGNSRNSAVTDTENPYNETPNLNDLALLVWTAEVIPSYLRLLHNLAFDGWPLKEREHRKDPKQLDCNEEETYRTELEQEQDRKQPLSLRCKSALNGV